MELLIVQGHNIVATEQHRLKNLSSAVQHNVPQQPSQSYDYLAFDPDDDGGDGFYLTTS